MQSVWARRAARLLEARWVLLGIGLLLFLLALTDRLHPLEALALLAVIGGIALLLPSRRRSAAQNRDETVQTRETRDETLNAFADALETPCILISERTLVLHANPAARRQFKVAIGSPLAFSLRDPALLAAIDQSRNADAPRMVELRQAVPTQAWWQVSVSPLHLGEATPSQRSLSVLTMRDLTEQKRVEAMRADFIAYASHELRTPLTSLIGFIDTLLGPAANDAGNRTRFLGIMRTQAERMSKLIDDLLSLSRIEQRQHLLPSGRIELSKLVREVAEGLQMQAAEAGVELKFDLAEAPAQINGERDELYEVIENLVDNAIKYGGDGETIDVALRLAEGRPAFKWSLTVTDNGPGIPSEHVPRLTERFYRVDAESSRKKKGTGLGLAIVKHIVNRHRGQLLIRSELGKGTTVEVLLPE